MNCRTTLSSLASLQNALTRKSGKTPIHLSFIRFIQYEHNEINQTQTNSKSKANDDFINHLLLLAAGIKSKTSHLYLNILNYDKSLFWGHSLLDQMFKLYR